MITDEQHAAFEHWAQKHLNADWFNYVCAWQAWQAAQQIKPLEFEKAGYWVKADCSFGRYVVSDEAGIWQIFLNGNVFECEYINKAEAIEAAKEDYQRRVLSCLVHGGTK